MMNETALTHGIVVVAHAPLASALRSVALHVLPALAADVVAVDVDANDGLEQVHDQVDQALQALQSRPGVLVLADTLGATPCNVAAQVVASRPNAHLLAGVNLPMLLRALTYRSEPLHQLVRRALDGGRVGVVVAAADSKDSGAGHAP